MEPRSAMIKVIGVGGGGCNVVNHMIAQGLRNVDYICANTDAQALGNAGADIKLVIGSELTRGLGAGANPDIGRQAALEDEEQIREVLQGTDMLFINAGMGGGTGTGAAPIIARIAKELDILTVAVVTQPFHFEGRKRAEVAEEGIAELRKYVHSLIIIPNNKLFSLGKNISLINAFKAANDVSLNAVEGIASLITCPGLINVDFADVRTVMSETGMAMMGTGIAPSAREAAESAIKCHLLEGINIYNARGILVNITGSPEMNIGEFEDVGEVIKSLITDNATVVIGTVINPDPEFQNKIQVTIVITGIEQLTDNDAVATTHTYSNQKPSYQTYGGTEQPAYLRRNKQPSFASALSQHSASTASIQAEEEKTPESAQNQTEELGYLNIPAFIRRQAKEKITA